MPADSSLTIACDLQEINDGFSSLPLATPVELSQDDFVSLSQQHALGSFDSAEGG